MATDDARVRARTHARQQLRRVMVVLGFLDASVLVLVLGLAVAFARGQLPAILVLAFAIGGLGGIILIRVALGVRLRRRSGDL